MYGLTLILSVCLYSNPTKCKEDYVNFTEENITPIQCMMNSVPELAKWQEYHPRWFVKKWTCKPSKSLGKDT